MANYRIALSSDIEDFEESDNPVTARDDLTRLRQECPVNRYLILRNGKGITEKELDDDIALYGDFTKSSKVPFGFRSGKWGGEHDLGKSPQDVPTSIWKPPNPEDEYE